MNDNVALTFVRQLSTSRFSASIGGGTSVLPSESFQARKRQLKSGGQLLVRLVRTTYVVLGEVIDINFFFKLDHFIFTRKITERL